MQLGSFLASGETMFSSSSIEPWMVRYRGKLLELSESVLVHLPGVGKGSGKPVPKQADRWKSARVAGQERPHRRASGQN